MVSHAKGQEFYYNIQNKNVHFEFNVHNGFLNMSVVICDREVT